jgi:NAD(P)H dehydrogenase (quinone)
MILVTGANGHFGKATIDFLLQKGVSPNNIAGLVREEAKGAGLKAKGITVKVGNYNDYNSLIEAFKGVDKLLLVSGTDVANRSKQHENAVKAAKEAGVKHIVYTSFERKNETGTSPLGLLAASHLHTERVIKESGIPYTILRNNFYLDYIPLFLGEKVLETGVFFAAGEGKMAMATRNDMAEAAATILTTTGHENKEYFISNSEEFSFRDIADILSNVTGKTVPYISPDTSTYVDTLVNAGVPKEVADASAGYAEAIKQGELSLYRSDLENLLGRKPTSLKEYLREVYGSK